MRDLTNPKLIYAKALLLLLLALLASAGLLYLHRDWLTAALLAAAVWASARFYYFAFYVIQHYLDPSYRFSGLSSFALDLLRRRKPH
jgi:hypothetical protein